MRAFVPVLAAGTFLVPGPTQSQPSGAVTLPETHRPTPLPVHETIIYRDRNFSGPAVAIDHDRPNLRLAWTVSSARVHGGAWQLCELPNYRGRCMTLSNDTRNLGHQRVQSVRLSRPSGSWTTLGRSDINRVGWVRRTIDVRGHPGMSQVRLCAERAQLRLHDARIHFGNNLMEVLHVPSQLVAGNCTAPIVLTGGRRFLSSVEVTAATVGINVLQARLRIEGR